MSEHRSEVAHLLQQMKDEYEAGQRGLIGLAAGTAQHQFIMQRIEQMTHCQLQLIALVGNEQASSMLAEVRL